MWSKGDVRDSSCLIRVIQSYMMKAYTVVLCALSSAYI